MNRRKVLTQISAFTISFLLLTLGIVVNGGLHFTYYNVTARATLAETVSAETFQQLGMDADVARVDTNARVLEWQYQTLDEVEMLLQGQGLTNSDYELELVSPQFSPHVATALFWGVIVQLVVGGFAIYYLGAKKIKSKRVLAQLALSQLVVIAVVLWEWVGMLSWLSRIYKLSEISLASILIGGWWLSLLSARQLWQLADAKIDFARDWRSKWIELSELAVKDARRLLVVMTVLFAGIALPLVGNALLDLLLVLAVIAHSMLLHQFLNVNWPKLRLQLPKLTLVRLQNKGKRRRGTKK